MITVREPHTIEEAESLAQFARDKFAPHAETWYCGGWPYYLEKQLRELYTNPNIGLLIAFDNTTIIGYLVIELNSQQCIMMRPDIGRAAEAIGAMLDEALIRYPQFWVQTYSDEFKPFFSQKLVQEEDGFTYRTASP